MLKCYLFLITLICVFASCNEKKPVKIIQTKTRSFETDLVPDSTTAIKIAEAIWLPIYGKMIYDERPYVATLKDSVWIVEGTLEKYVSGGTAYIEIRKKDCRVLMVTHYK